MTFCTFSSALASSPQSLGSRTGAIARLAYHTPIDLAGKGITSSSGFRKLIAYGTADNMSFMFALVPFTPIKSTGR